MQKKLIIIFTNIASNYSGTLFVSLSVLLFLLIFGAVSQSQGKQLNVSKVFINLPQRLF